MREIKFRAWDKEAKMFVYFIVKLGEEVYLDPTIFDKELYVYIGLKDKNGKEIYEGDIIRSDKYNYPHKIIYTLGEFVGKQVRGKFKGYVNGMFFDRFEVIGNTKQNGDLIE